MFYLQNKKNVKALFTSKIPLTKTTLYFYWGGKINPLFCPFGSKIEKEYYECPN